MKTAKTSREACISFLEFAANELGFTLADKAKLCGIEMHVLDELQLKNQLLLITDEELRVRWEVVVEILDELDRLCGENPKAMRRKIEESQPLLKEGGTIKAYMVSGKFAHLSAVWVLLQSLSR